MVNTVLWFVQIFLALFFVAAAVPKITRRGLEQWTGFSSVPPPLTFSIGVAELLGSAGLVLPMAIGVLPWLTPLAAIGLGVNVLMAAGFHVRADERSNAIEATLWAIVTAIVAIGRWNLIARAGLSVGPAVLVGVLAVVLPAAVINVIVLARASSRHAERQVNARKPDQEKAR